MVGLGIDAAIMGAVSKPLKYRIGPLAVGLAAAKVLPEHRPFPLEIWNTKGDACDQMFWKGEALQVIIGNTRLYAKVVEMTPKATIDDGALDVSVITAGEPLTTLQQITSLLLRRTPAEMTAEYFKGAHLALRVPASIPLQVDGSAAKLKDYLGSRNWQSLEQTEQLDNVFVTYRFDALPRALDVLVPRDYDDTLFEHKQNPEPAHTQTTAEPEDGPHNAPPEQTAGKPAGTEQPEPPTHLKVAQRLGEHGRMVKTLGVSPLPERKNTILIAGCTISRQTGEEKPVALYLNRSPV